MIKELKEPITKKNVKLVVDRLGKRIEEKIIPLVLALNKVGFVTTASCQGHANWSRGWPWVDVIYKGREDNERFLKLESILKAHGWEYGVQIGEDHLEIRPNFRKGNLRTWQYSINKLSKAVENYEASSL